MGIKKTKLEDFQLIIYFSLTQGYVTRKKNLEVRLFLDISKEGMYPDPLAIGILTFHHPSPNLTHSLTAVYSELLVFPSLATVFSVI